MPGTPEARPGPVAILAALLILWAPLALPNYPAGLASRAWLRVPLELPVLVILLVVLQGRAAHLLRLGVTLGVGVTSLLKLADLAAFTAFARPVNAALDWPLAISAWQLASGAVGIPLALGVLLLLGIAILAVGLAIWGATGILARLAPPPGLRLGLGLALVPALIAATYGFARPDPGAASGTARLAWEHLRDGWSARADLARFRLAAAEDPHAGMPALGALAGHDVFVIFVESYGRTTLDTPSYRATTEAVLRGAEAELGARGLVARSAFLTAPMVGGQSWLAHGSLLSGLRLDSEGRYRALLASPRKTLLRLAQGAGWRTVALMPAITLAWPEAGYFGYDRVLAAADLGYRGRPFNWITMPDQFALASLERQELDRQPRPPVFVEAALISSHAPWIPVPPMLPWEDLGDGRVFDPVAAGGETPEALWRDPDRVRDQYRQAIAYSLRAVFGFAARRGETRPVFVVLGDHQPAGFVAQEPGNRDVPVHLVGPPDLVARIGGWGWSAGLVPAEGAPVWPMEDFRDRLLAAFAGSPG